MRFEIAVLRYSSRIHQVQWDFQKKLQLSKKACPITVIVLTGKLLPLTNFCPRKLLSCGTDSGIQTLSQPLHIQMAAAFM
jgi:hypothetical protein